MPASLLFPLTSLPVLSLLVPVVCQTVEELDLVLPSVDEAPSFPTVDNLDSALTWKSVVLRVPGRVERFCRWRIVVLSREVVVDLLVWVEGSLLALEDSIVFRIGATVEAVKHETYGDVAADKPSA